MTSWQGTQLLETGTHINGICSLPCQTTSLNLGRGELEIKLTYLMCFASLCGQQRVDTVMLDFRAALYGAVTAGFHVDFN